MRTNTFDRAPATAAVLAVSVAVIAGACSADADPTAESSAATSTTAVTATTGRNTDAAPGADGTAPAPATASTSTTPPSQRDQREAAVLRFTAGATQIGVTVTDNPTTRDLISMLPLTLRFEEFNGREKIAYLPEWLDTPGSPGLNPENDDLIYYAPWGNLGFYYNTDGIEYSDQVIHIGDYTATLDELERLENGDVTVELIEAVGAR